MDHDQRRNLCRVPSSWVDDLEQTPLPKVRSASLFYLTNNLLPIFTTYAYANIHVYMYTNLRKCICFAQSRDCPAQTLDPWFTDVCGWTVGWIIKRYHNLVLATQKNSSRISLYDICFCEPISYSSYDIPRRENAHENTLPQLYVSHNCPRTTFIMSGSAQPVFTSM